MITDSFQNADSLLDNVTIIHFKHKYAITFFILSKAGGILKFPINYISFFAL